jgi:hypothetical protein
MRAGGLLELHGPRGSTALRRADLGEEPIAAREQAVAVPPASTCASRKSPSTECAETVWVIVR